MPTRRDNDAYHLKSIKDSLPSLSFSSTSNPTTTTSTSNSASNFNTRPSRSTRPYHHEDSPHEPSSTSRHLRGSQGAVSHRSDHRSGRSPDVRYISPYSDDSDSSSAYTHPKQQRRGNHHGYDYDHHHQQRSTLQPSPSPYASASASSTKPPSHKPSRGPPARVVSVHAPTGPLHDADRRRKGFEGGYHLGSEYYGSASDRGGIRGRQEDLDRGRRRDGRRDGGYGGR